MCASDPHLKRSSLHRWLLATGSLDFRRSKAKLRRIPWPYFSNAATARLTLPTAGTIKDVCSNAWYVVQACC